MIVSVEELKAHLRIQQDAEDTGQNIALIQVHRNAVCSISLRGNQAKDELHVFRCKRVNYQIMNRLILFIGASRIFQAIPIRDHPSAKVTILYHLLLS